MPVSTSVPYSRGSIDISVDDVFDLTVLEPPHATPLAEPARKAAHALKQPIGTGQLEDMAHGKRSVVIAVTDATRACPDHILVPPMLAALERAGIPDDAITILVAVGAHRASTDEEKRAKLGDAICNRYRVVDHDGTDEDGLVPVLTHESGKVFRVNRQAVEADLLLSTGIVEPHQYAGFSGGGKTVAIGCADEAVIAHTHGPAYLDDPNTRLANITTNPFQQAVRAVARAAGLAFVGNAVLDDDNHPIAIAYGHPEAVHDALTEIAGRTMTVPIPHQFDIAIGGVGYPKDENLYQASRAASYLQFAPTPVVREGGSIVISARCPEGAGQGAGERRFAESMRHPGGLSAILAEARANGIQPGGQRAYVMAQVLETIDVIITGADRPDELEALGVRTAPTVEAALAEEQARLAMDRPKVLLVPHALTTLPIVS